MKVTKTHCVVSRAGRMIGHFKADTIFINEIPHVVFEWEHQPDGSEKPVCLVALDPRYFHHLSDQGEVNHMYELPIEDPRSLI